MNDQLLYLDHAAATPLDSRVLEAMQPYFAEKFYNPSSPYAPAVAVRREYEAAKAAIAQVIGACGDELVMTAGATESIALAFASVNGRVVTTNIEHQAVMAAAGPEAIYVPVDKNGRVSAEAIARVITPETELVSVALANNELGTIQPLSDIAQVVKKERQRRVEAGELRQIYFHSDASQGSGLIDIHIAKLGVDMLTLNAAKVYGPKQTGLLWAHSSVVLRPIIEGGGQERGLRSGTENVANVVGFARALELASKHQKAESLRLRELRDQLEKTISSAFPDAVLSGHRKHRLPSHLHISFPGIDAERLVFALEMRNVLVATGSACAANKGTRSHVLTAIGLDDTTADGSLRLSLGKLTDETIVAHAGEIIIEEITKELQRLAR